MFIVFIAYFTVIHDRWQTIIYCVSALYPPTCPAACTGRDSSVSWQIGWQLLHVPVQREMIFTVQCPSWQTSPRVYHFFTHSLTRTLNSFAVMIKGQAELQTVKNILLYWSNSSPILSVVSHLDIHLQLQATFKVEHVWRGVDVVYRWAHLINTTAIQCVFIGSLAGHMW